MKILVTGFEPFGGEKINPSIEAVHSLPEQIEGIEIVKIQIPVVRWKALAQIEQAVKQYNPDVILSVGQAGGRSDISVERIGINVDDFGIKDNEGNQPIDKIIKEDGQAAYFSNLPIKAMVKHMNDNKIPATVSNTAGTFVCNHVMYGILYMIDKKYPNIKGGFIHIPYMTSQVIDKKNTPFMSLEEIAKGLELAIEACTLYKEDIKTIGGEIC